MTKSARILAALALSAMALLLLPLALSSCSSGQAEVPKDSEGRIIVEFWHAMGRRQGQSLTDIVDAFNKSQDKYKVVGIYQGNYNSLAQKLIASLYAGRNPAITQAYPGWVTRYHKTGYVQPVSHFAASDPEWVKNDLPDFYPVMIEESTFPNPDGSGDQIVTLPFNKSVYVLYINQTLMESVGWTEPPKTWAEFRELAAAMTKMGPAGEKPEVYGFASRPYIEDYTVQLMSSGLVLMDEKTGKVLVDSPESIESLAFLKELVAGKGERQVGYVETDYLSNVFGSGKIGMYISSTASFTYNDTSVGTKFIWRAYEVPMKDEKTAGKTLMQGTAVCIFNNVDEEVQQGAWEFMKFLTSPEMTARWSQETGYMPVRRSANEVPELKAHIERDISFANSIKTLEHATYEPRVVYWESIRQVMSRAVESVLLDRAKAEDAMMDVSKEIQRIRERAE
jgi:multiple sugar transport system substrate-binding protein